MSLYWKICANFGNDYSSLEDARNAHVAFMHIGSARQRLCEPKPYLIAHMRVRERPSMVTFFHCNEGSSTLNIGDSNREPDRYEVFALANYSSFWSSLFPPTESQVKEHYGEAVKVLIDNKYKLEYAKWKYCALTSEEHDRETELCLSECLSSTTVS